MNSNDILAKVEQSIENDRKESNDLYPSNYVNVARCFTSIYSRISMKNDDLNKECLNKALDSRFDVYGNPVGYLIHNFGTQIIKGVKYPEYKYDEASKLYVGTVKQKDIGPDEFFILPTKWLMLFLLEHNNGKLDLANGEMVKLFDIKDDDNDLDAALSNFKFRGSTSWKELEESPLFYRVISAIKIDASGNIIERHAIPEERFSTLFAYLLNPISKSEVSIEGNLTENNSTNITNAAKLMSEILK